MSAYFKWEETKLFLTYNKLDVASAAVYNQAEENSFQELLK